MRLNIDLQQIEYRNNKIISEIDVKTTKRILKTTEFGEFSLPRWLHSSFWVPRSGNRRSSKNDGWCSTINFWNLLYQLSTELLASCVLSTKSKTFHTSCGKQASVYYPPTPSLGVDTLWFKRVQNTLLFLPSHPKHSLKCSRIPRVEVVNRWKSIYSTKK